MSLVLMVDLSKWQSHLDAFQSELNAATNNSQALVPVIKGNGYGVGLARLIEQAQRMGVTEVAVDTVLEANFLNSDSKLTIQVLQPVRDSDEIKTNDYIYTIDQHSPIEKLPANAKVIVEVKTSLQRFGIELTELSTFLKSIPVNISVIGIGTHLPIGNKKNLAQVKSIAEVVNSYALAGNTRINFYTSHLTNAELTALAEFRQLNLRVRIGTGLWLGDRSALQLEGEILEIRAVNSRIGYGQRRIRSSQVAIISGGTKHGIGLRAAATPTGIRSKLVSVALGLLEALGDARSPFVYKGKALNFVDTPHMSVSMILLPKNHDLKIGQYLKAQVRFTTTNPDWVLTK
ncbi:MAG: hypothetical protein GM45_1630 [actinobacterium acAMD-5]|nr:MAG: hypothetical protein GM45_1630 [actinobacterium acAMD-5]